VSDVEEWTGFDARRLRLARRMSVREFAAHLGVSDRIVSRWEAGGLEMRPREVNQAALDESLRRCNKEERRRFDDMGAMARPVRACLVIELPTNDVERATVLAANLNAAVAAMSIGSVATRTTTH
jgi:transcriptional regulator with XRE-family HTH domain